MFNFSIFFRSLIVRFLKLFVKLIDIRKAGFVCDIMNGH